MLKIKITSNTFENQDQKNSLSVASDKLSGDSTVDEVIALFSNLLDIMGYHKESIKKFIDLK